MNDYRRKGQYRATVGIRNFNLARGCPSAVYGVQSNVVVVVVVVFTLKAVPISTQYFLTSVLVQLTRTPSVVTG